MWHAPLRLPDLLVQRTGAGMTSLDQGLLTLHSLCHRQISARNEPSPSTEETGPARSKAKPVHAILVFHAFQKKTQKAPEREMALGRND